MSKLIKISSILNGFLLFLNLLSAVSPTLTFANESDKQRCYIEELFENSVLMIKWKIRGLEDYLQHNSQEDSLPNPVSKFLQHLHLIIYADDTNKTVKLENLAELRGKISFKSKSEGYFKICINYNGPWINKNYKNTPLMSLQFSSDNMDEPDIENAIKSSDVQHLHEKAKSIISMGGEIIQKQESDFSLEDSTASDCIELSKKYYTITGIQAIVVLGVGIFQIIQLRKFLAKQYL